MREREINGSRRVIVVEGEREQHTHTERGREITVIVEVVTVVSIGVFRSTQRLCV